MHDIHDERSERTQAKAEAAGSLTESLAGIAVVALAIIALTGVIPFLLVAISVIVAGGALMLQGGTIAGLYAQSVSRPRGEFAEREYAGGGLGAEFIAGATGIVLGILALIGMVPMVLVAVAVICFGTALLISAGATAGAANLVAFDETRAGRLAAESVRAAGGSQAFVGLGAVVLGILALIGVEPLLLGIIGMLAVGVSIMMTGSALSGRTLMFARHYKERRI